MNVVSEVVKIIGDCYIDITKLIEIIKEWLESFVFTSTMHLNSAHDFIEFKKSDDGIIVSKLCPLAQSGDSVTSHF